MHLQQLILTGKRQDAIRIMTDVVKEIDDKIFNDIILIGAQMSRNEELKVRNLLSFEDFTLADNQSVNALLNLIQKVDALENFDPEEYKNRVRLDDSKKKKILFFAANPACQQKLDLEKEYLSIRKVIKPYRDKFEIIEEFDVTLDNFFEIICKEQPEIIHFSGFAEKNELLFCREKDRKAHHVSDEFIAAAFKMLPQNVECFFMNTDTGKLFAKISSRNTQHTIGADGKILDDDSISFAMGFYTSLAIEGNYKKAFENGRESLANFRETKTNGKLDLGSGAKSRTIDYIFYNNGVSYDENDATPDSFYDPTAVNQYSKNVYDDPYDPSVNANEEIVRGDHNPFNAG